MQNLLIEQKSADGLLKTWRIKPEEGNKSFGQSKHADLRTAAESVNGIQGVFEFRKGQWFYLNLDPHSQSNSQDEICLDHPIDLSMGTTTLSVMPLKARQTLFTDLGTNQELNSPKTGTSPYQIVTVYHQGQLLETKVIPLGTAFSTRLDPNNTQVPTSPCDRWTSTQVGNLLVSQKTVHLSSVEALKIISHDQVIDDGGRKTLTATLAGAALLALLFLLSPSSRNAEEVAVASAPPIEYREMKLSPPIKKKQSAPVAEVKPQMQQTAPAAQATAQAAASAPASPPTGGKAVSAIKALGQSRISQLIGKISATSAKSNNIVVSAGIAAGTAPSGRALAAVGGVTQSGHDYTGDGSGKGIRVATVGHAGGGSTQGLGSISGGKTGSGGVGLLEEDGEVVGGLDREVIAAYIRSRLGEILYCYERQLSAQPDLYGKVAVKFTIAGTGGVEAQRVGETTLRNSTVEGCILQRMSKWKFPTPEGGTKVLVTYPFLFKSTN